MENENQETSPELYDKFVEKYSKLIQTHHKELVAGLKISKLNPSQKNKMVEKLREVEVPFVQDYADVIEKTGLALTAEMAWEDLDPETIKILEQMNEQIPNFRKPSDS